MVFIVCRPSCSAAPCVARWCRLVRHRRVARRHRPDRLPNAAALTPMRRRIAAARWTLTCNGCCWPADRVRARLGHIAHRPAPVAAPAARRGAYANGLNLLPQRAARQTIDAFIEAVQREPETPPALRARQHVPPPRRIRPRGARARAPAAARRSTPRCAEHALGTHWRRDFMKAGLLDRAEQAYRAPRGNELRHRGAAAPLSLHADARATGRRRSTSRASSSRRARRRPRASRTTGARSPRKPMRASGPGGRGGARRSDGLRAGPDHPLITPGAVARAGRPAARQCRPSASCWSCSRRRSAWSRTTTRQRRWPAGSRRALEQVGALYRRDRPATCWPRWRWRPGTGAPARRLREHLGWPAHARRRAGCWPWARGARSPSTTPTPALGEAHGRARCASAGSATAAPRGLRTPAPILAVPRLMTWDSVPAQRLRTSRERATRHDARRLGAARVLVVGDAMLDRYWFGSVERISPEAPVPGRARERGESAWAARPTSRSTSARSAPGDADGRRRRRAGAPAQALLAGARRGDAARRDPQLRTIVKLRVIGRSAAADPRRFENQPDHEVLAGMLADYAQALPAHEVLKGPTTARADDGHPRMIELARAARQAGADRPKGDDYSRYAGATSRHAQPRRAGAGDRRVGQRGRPARTRTSACGTSSASTGCC